MVLQATRAYITYDGRRWPNFLEDVFEINPSEYSRSGW
jgi:hypothetical protein